MAYEWNPLQFVFVPKMILKLLNNIKTNGKGILLYEPHTFSRK